MHSSAAKALFLPLPSASIKIPLKSCMTSAFMYLFHTTFHTISFRLLSLKKVFPFTSVILELQRFWLWWWMFVLVAVVNLLKLINF